MATIKLLRTPFLSIKRHDILLKRSASIQTTDFGGEDEFRVLELYPKFDRTDRPRRRRFDDAQVLPPRETRMPIDQDWPSVWPTAKTFRPSVVPLPVHQGYDQKRAPPGKYANAELMKIPNFLHLTPNAIKRHCAAIKQFCTEFPKGLKTDSDCEKHFPVEIITSDFCHSSPTILDERSRVVTLKVNLSSLKLDYHGNDKLTRLLSGHANLCKNTGIITLVADRCPLRKQNYEYLIYLLTALHHESWVMEPWEHEKTEADMEKFFFEGSRIQQKMIKTIKQMKSSSKSSLTEKEIQNSKEVELFGEAVTDLINNGEENSKMLKYKAAVLKSLNLDS